MTAISATASGCSDDNVPDNQPEIEIGNPVEISLAISSMRSGTETGDGTPSDPATSAEKINSWWIAFVDNGGTVRQVVNRQASGAVEMETFKCTVPSGAYTLYAFANITSVELKKATGVELTPGKPVSLPAGISGIEDAVWNVSLNRWDASKPLPMSGVLRDVRVRNITEEVFSIEVVRMMAKIEFLFSNLCDKGVTINSVSVDPVTITPVSLFPRGEGGVSYSHLGVGAYSPLAGAEYDKIDFPISSDNVIAAGEEKKSMTIYLQESVSVRDNDKSFTIGINVSHEEGVDEYQQYNITRDILSYINRNDHIRIPVSLSRYDVDVDAVFYPPIGGYPAVSDGLDPDGSQIFTFSSEGDFSVVAHVTDKQTGRHLAPQYYSVAVSDISDPKSIFSNPPAVASLTPALPDEVAGTLSAIKGKASFKITVSVFDKPRYEPDAKITAGYTRAIYIIRD